MIRELTSSALEYTETQRKALRRWRQEHDLLESRFLALLAITSLLAGYLLAGLIDPPPEPRVRGHHWIVTEKITP